MRLARVNKAISLLKNGGYKPYILSFGTGLTTGIKVLRFLIAYTTTYRADIVIREGLGRVKSKFYHFLTYYLPFFKLS